MRVDQTVQQLCKPAPNHLVHPVRLLLQFDFGVLVALNTHELKVELFDLQFDRGFDANLEEGVLVQHLFIQ
jgi:hypothetical protein